MTQSIVRGGVLWDDRPRSSPFLFPRGLHDRSSRRRGRNKRLRVSCSELCGKRILLVGRKPNSPELVGRLIELPGKQALSFAPRMTWIGFCTGGDRCSGPSSIPTCSSRRFSEGFPRRRTRRFWSGGACSSYLRSSSRSSPRRFAQSFTLRKQRSLRTFGRMAELEKLCGRIGRSAYSATMRTTRYWSVRSWGERISSCRETDICCG